MKKPMSPFFFLIISFLLATSSVPRVLPQVADTTTATNSDFVVIEVQAINTKTKRFVSGLKKEDFLVYEDGSKREIAESSEGENALSLVLLLDVSGSMRFNSRIIKDACSEILSLLKPEDEVALMTFADAARVVEGFTKDRDAIRQKVGQLEREKIHGATYVNEAMYQAAIQMRKAGNWRGRHIVVITDNERMDFFQPHPENQAIEELLKVGAGVNGLIVSPADGRRVHEDGFKRRAPLDSFVNRAGGIVLYLEAKDATTRLKDMIDILHKSYTLTYERKIMTTSAKASKLAVKLSAEAQKREGKTVLLTRIVPAKNKSPE